VAHFIVLWFWEGVYSRKGLWFLVCRTFLDFVVPAQIAFEGNASKRADPGWKNDNCMSFEELLAPIFGLPFCKS